MRIVALLMLLMGCATLPLQSGDGEAVCLPEGVSDAFLRWPISWAQPASWLGTRGVSVRYERQEQAVMIFWAQGFILLVDPAPDTDVPGWLRVLDEPCAWRRLAGRNI